MDPAQENRAGQNRPLPTGWQILRERHLPIEMGAAGVFREWLEEILLPLDLPVDYSEKILHWALEIVRRAERDGERVRLTLFVPIERAGKAQSWGFFRVEMIEGAVGDSSSLEHAIEFYLYREGR